MGEEQGFSNGYKWVSDAVRENRDAIRDIRVELVALHILAAKIETDLGILKGWMRSKTETQKQISAEGTKGKWALVVTMVSGFWALVGALVAAVLKIYSDST